VSDTSSDLACYSYIIILLEVDIGIYSRGSAVGGHLSGVVIDSYSQAGPAVTLPPLKYERINIVLHVFSVTT